MNKKELYELSDRLLNRAKEINAYGFNKREIYKIVNREDSIIIIGPRRIGKTTLLEEVVRFYTKKYKIITLPIISVKEFTRKVVLDQKAFTMIDVNVKSVPRKVLYLKLDSLEFSSMSKKELEQLQLLIRNTVIDDKVDFLLLDEIQTLPNWTILVKDIKDLATNKIRVIGTGSNSNKLMEGTEHGTGRYNVEFYGVLSLKEYKELKSIESLTGNHYKNYLQYGHFPNYDERTYKDEVSSAIIEKAFGSTEKNKANIFKVLKWIVQNPGQEIVTSKIGGTLEISRQYIEDYLSVLQDGQLIYKLPNSIGKTVKRKVYSLIPGAFTLFYGKTLSETTNEEKGSHFENFVFIQLVSLTHSLSDRMEWGFLKDAKSRGKNEIDFVYGKVGFEVKLTLHQDHKDYIHFAKSKGIETLYLVYKNGDRLKNFSKDGINVKYIRWEDFANQKKITQIRKDLKLENR